MFINSFLKVNKCAFFHGQLTFSNFCRCPGGFRTTEAKKVLCNKSSLTFCALKTNEIFVAWLYF